MLCVELCRVFAPLWIALVFVAQLGQNLVLAIRCPLFLRFYHDVLHDLDIMLNLSQSDCGCLLHELGVLSMLLSIHFGRFAEHRLITRVLLYVHLGSGRQDFLWLSVGALLRWCGLRWCGVR
eukprot:gnl/TRDRNA2_/TRDRNA2_209030_c0_seq1.p1 gnl/TRDRNA2_/TRDRNA2_209030_c0~~gnl/TRDRNA2_/TRDRNA2_209030_c0_seq1.p1  ORF type:complete len:122 (-),score=2.15 gnl/TRDRNA2_/TRDRNA2_209030_c0_seq1:14-379(-)